MASAALITRYTPEQYLALERKQSSRASIYDGFIIAMAGASREHNLITGNLGRRDRQPVQEPALRDVFQRHARPRQPDSDSTRTPM